ncbi:cytidylyltransferase domain-containing protein [Desulfohalovibrio reitneri]|uniref:acylneuraminate cytidylyltransferase family protein n=1 Tax=Desulfohalovibrio reitneri TaxID=1307759 RepID=UPI0006905AFD|nr:acylneuraminate cytidylyltransferase family protein [Desulfohalovibrio reitneri]
MSRTPLRGRGVLAVIPARGGSKGIPGKNLRLLGGVPLVGHSIRTALAVPEIDRVVVSTDSPELAEEAVRLGAEVPFLRPPELATDEAEISQALLHLRNRLFETEGYAPQAQVVLYPTHPFRKAPVVGRLVGRLLEGYETVTTCRRVMPGPAGYLTDHDGAARPLLDHDVSPAGRTYYRSYGFFKGTSFDFQARGDYLHVIEDEVECIDIDEPEDLRLAEEVIRLGLYDFEL